MDYWREGVWRFIAIRFVEFVAYLEWRVII